MREGLLCLLCLWLLTGPAAALVLRIVTDPPECRVLLIPSGSSNPRDAKFVGFSGKNLIFKTENSILHTKEMHLTLVLEHPGCVSRIIEVDCAKLSQSGGGDWPPDGKAVELEYQSWLTKMQVTLPYLPVAAVPTALALALWLVMRKVRRQETTVKSIISEQTRNSRLSQMIVPAADKEAMIGARIDDYRILERIGSGGMARVYRAVPEGTLLEADAVAIKILNRELSQDQKFVTRFDREKSVYEQLRHPNIVRIFGAGCFEGNYYLTMELIRGTTLRSYVQPGGLPPKRLLELFSPLMDAVAYAHRRNIMHRDLKPENVMMAHSGSLKVMDFGMARGSDYDTVTETGALMGTPAYMAPEQIRGEHDIQADQYAIGVMIYEMLTGSLPFQDEHQINVILKHLNAPVPDLARDRPELASLAPVVARMLSKDAAQRYRDLSHALSCLRQAIP